MTTSDIQAPGPKPQAPSPRPQATGHAHQFDDAEQQRTSASLGMWVFLATEVMFFGGLFAAYAIYRLVYPQAFAEASHHLDVVLGGLNTAVLLTSSLTMALAVHAAQTGRRGWLVGMLLLTALLGAAFMGVKATEYYHEYQERLIPALGFGYAGADAQQVQLFFLLYFLMTGLHAIHLTIGIVAALAFAALALRRGARPRATPVEVLGLYWHFIDIVWVFLFPLLYLIGHG